MMSRMTVARTEKAKPMVRSVVDRHSAGFSGLIGRLADGRRFAYRLSSPPLNAAGLVRCPVIPTGGDVDAIWAVFTEKGEAEESVVIPYDELVRAAVTERRRASAPDPLACVESIVGLGMSSVRKAVRQEASAYASPQVATIA